MSKKSVNESVEKLEQRLGSNAHHVRPAIATRWFLEANEASELAIRSSELNQGSVANAMINLAGRVLSPDANIKPPLSDEQRSQISATLADWAILASTSSSPTSKKDRSNSPKIGSTTTLSKG